MAFWCSQVEYFYTPTLTKNVVKTKNIRSNGNLFWGDFVLLGFRFDRISILRDFALTGLMRGSYPTGFACVFVCRWCTVAECQNRPSWFWCDGYHWEQLLYIIWWSGSAHVKGDVLRRWNIRRWGVGLGKFSALATPRSAIPAAVVLTGCGTRWLKFVAARTSGNVDVGDSYAQTKTCVIDVATSPGGHRLTTLHLSNSAQHAQSTASACQFLSCIRYPRVSAKALCFRAVRPSVRPFVRPETDSGSGQILLPRYRMNGLNNLDETYREYSIAHTTDLIRFWRSKVKVKVIDGRRVGEGIHVDAAVSKSI